MNKMNKKRNRRSSLTMNSIMKVVIMASTALTKTILYEFLKNLIMWFLYYLKEMT